MPSFRRLLSLLLLPPSPPHPTQHSTTPTHHYPSRFHRLKRFINSTAGPQVLNAVLEALKTNTKVEALYIQNFEEGCTHVQVVLFYCKLSSVAP